MIAKSRTRLSELAHTFSFPPLRTAHAPNCTSPAQTYKRSNRVLRWSYALSPVAPPFGLEGAVLPFGPPGSLGQRAPQSVENGLRVMAATRTASRACEIFTTLEYGPAPESHACALVRACLDPRCLYPFAVVRAQCCARTPVIHRGSSAAPPSRLPLLLRVQAGGRSLGPLRLLPLCPLAVLASLSACAVPRCKTQCTASPTLQNLSSGSCASSASPQNLL